MNYKFLLLPFIFISLNACSQKNQDLSVEFKNLVEPIILTLNESIDIYYTTNQNYSQLIKLKSDKLNRISSEMPEKFRKLKEDSDKIAKALNDLDDYIQLIKNESKKNHFDTYNYVMMTDTLFYSNIIFEEGGSLSQRGLILKEKITEVYKTNLHVLNSSHNKAMAYNDAKFKTDRLLKDYDGKEHEYIHYKLMDRTVIGFLTNLERIQLELKTFQLLYMNSIIQN